MQKILRMGSSRETDKLSTAGVVSENGVENYNHSVYGGKKGFFGYGDYEAAMFNAPFYQQPWSNEKELQVG